MDLTNAQQKSIERMDSFPAFLGTLSDERLQFYSDLVETLLENKQTSEDIQRVVLLYSLILKEVESKTVNDGEIRIAEDGSWVSSLFMFISVEKFYRSGLIKKYSGHLHDETLDFMPSEEMRNMSKGMSNTLEDAINQLKKKK